MTETEPTEPMKQAWNEVAEGFASLGRKITDRYHGEPPEPQETETGSHEPEPAAALREAFDRLISAALNLGDRAVAVVRDDEIKAQAKRAAASLNDAIGATVDMIGDEVSGLFRRPIDEPPPAAPVEATVSEAGPPPPPAEAAAEAAEPAPSQEAEPAPSQEAEPAGDSSPPDESAGDTPRLP